MKEILFGRKSQSFHVPFASQIRKTKINNPQAERECNSFGVEKT